MDSKIRALREQIKTLRIEQGVSTYDLQKAGLHSSLPRLIEREGLNVRVVTLMKYLEVCGLELIVKPKNKQQ
jgi:hypothetical protein